MNDRRAVLEVGAGDATDGAIDTQFIAEMFPDRYAIEDSDGILDPEAIANAYGRLHCQHRSAWTFELDLRPWMERWRRRDCGLRSTLRIPPIASASAPTRFPK